MDGGLIYWLNLIGYCQSLQAGASELRQGQRLPNPTSTANASVGKHEVQGATLCLSCMYRAANLQPQGNNEAAPLYWLNVQAWKLQ